MSGQIDELLSNEGPPEVIEGKKSNAVEKRQAKQKQQLLEQLKKTPVIQIACEKTGISRATFYRWKSEDNEFTKAIEVALHEGSELVNDMAESQLMAAIRDQNLGAITFWLKHHHPGYSNKVEINANIHQEMPDLTDDEKAMIEKALQLTSMYYDKPDDTLSIDKST